jgi:mono/diheme cytochrome c family protein
LKLRPGTLAPCLLAAALACLAAALRASSAAERSAPARPAPTCAHVKSHADEWAASGVDALVRAAHAAYEDDEKEPAYTRLLGRLADTLKRCGLAGDAGFVERHREFVGYVEAASPSALPDHELGFAVPDRRYFEETRAYVGVPDFLAERGFVRSASRFETLPRAKSYLRRLNSQRAPSEQLVFFSYKSRHLGTPDNPDSYVRLLVVVPGDAARGAPERWVQFGVTDPGVRTLTRNVSVVAGLARTDGTADFYFKDYYRTYLRDGSVTLKGRWELGHGDDNCVQCHKSGVLPIFPEAGSVSADESATVEEVNRRFRGYGAPRFGGYLDVSKFGPGLGASGGADREGRFGAGFGGSKVAGAMTCAACHRPDYLGALNWPMDSVLISSYVNGGQMPRGHELSDAVRRELYAKLVREYFDADAARPGIFKSWLLGRYR